MAAENNEKKDKRITVKNVSALEKHFSYESVEAVREYNRASALRGERFSYQVAYTCREIPGNVRLDLKIGVSSPISDYISVCRVERVPVRMPMYKVEADDYYMSREPGLYPDLLLPVKEGECVFTLRDEYNSVWVDVDIPKDAKSGVFPIELTLTDAADGESYSALFELEIIDAVLPEQELKFTQWFHSDCLATYYNVEIFSEEHWRIIGEFIKCAVKNGINMILTPVFTPALDTRVGGERPTVQLCDIYLDDGKWSFGFDRLRRWVSLCRECGIKYFEISHLFTQWGAEHAPKIMARVNGEYKKVFGWETDAMGKEYSDFLREFLPALKEELVSLGVFENTVFHLSDEPGGDKLENYLKAKSVVEDVLDGCVIMDALSDYSFYKRGALNTPVVSSNHIETYIEKGVKNLWAYYCCGQHKDVSNRLVAMPQARNRVIGVQLFKFDIAGFLQWGYNFYYSQGSVSPINPYHCNDGEYWVPAGDAFSVYPAPNGAAYETLHLVGFTQALQDLRAMRLLESLAGRECVMEIIEDPEEPITFTKYPHGDEYILTTREKINEKIKELSAKK